MVFRHIKTTFCHRNTKRSSTKYIINDAPKTYNDAVYPRLPFLIRAKKYNIKVGSYLGNNPGGQLRGLASSVTRLIRDERIELSYNKATEIRPHVERLIVEAMRNGDCHKPTMELANFWLVDKLMIHKLFKELVPRYSSYSSAFTALYRLGPDYGYAALTMTELKERHTRKRLARGDAVLELRGSNLPPIIRPHLNRSELLTNVLLSAVRERQQFDAKKLETTRGHMNQSETAPSQPSE